MNRLLLLSLACCTALTACADRSTFTAPGGAARADLLDGAHAGNPRFYFRPPLAPLLGSYPGRNDPRLLPFLSVSICAPTGCANPTVLEAPQLAVVDSFYQVTWYSPTVSAPQIQRITVLLGTTALGFADVQLVPAGKGRPTPPPGTLQLEGSARLQIRFLALSGAGCGGAPDCISTVVSPDTGNLIVTPLREALLLIPAHAWTTSLAVTINQIPDSAGQQDDCIPLNVDQPYLCYHYVTVPQVPRFLKPVTLAICADTATKTNQLQLFKWNEVNQTLALPHTDSIPPHVLECQGGTPAGGGGGGLAALWRRMAAPLERLLAPTPLYALLTGPTVTGSSQNLSHVTPVRVLLHKATVDSTVSQPGATIVPAVQVTGKDPGGNTMPLPNVPVLFSVAPGNGSVNGGASAVVYTAANGGASVAWTLPTAPGSYHMKATVANGVTETFTATVR